jgi:hypothetical protein
VDAQIYDDRRPWHAARMARPEPIDSSAPPDDRDVAIALRRLRVDREARRRLRAEGRPTETPEILTLRERLARPAPAVTWTIPGWQPAGSRIVLAGPAKAGKSTLVGGLVRALVDGARWLGVVDVPPIDGCVALLDTEMGPRQLDAWLGDQRIAHDDHVVVVPLRGRVGTLDLIDDETRAEWAARLRGLGVRYLIVDPLRPIMDAHGLDEHAEAGRLLVAIDALLDEAAIPDALIVHHHGHGAERARGDSRLIDWPDATWTLVRADDGGRYIRAEGRDVLVAESALIYDAETRTLTLAGGSRHEARLDGALGAVVDVLRETPDLSARAILSALAESEHPRDTIRAALRRGIDDGSIVAVAGPRRAILHRIGQCAGVRGECAARTASECAGVYIYPAHSRTLADQPDEPDHPRTRALTDPSTPRGPYGV